MVFSVTLPDDINNDFCKNVLMDSVSSFDLTPSRNIMKRISNWLESIIVRKPIDVGAYERQAPLPEIQEKSVNKEYGSYDHTPTLPVLTSLDEAMIGIIESPGFDPYNSGSFETSKSRSQK